MQNTPKKISDVMYLTEMEMQVDHYCKSCLCEIKNDLGKCSNKDCVVNGQIVRCFNTFKFFDIKNQLKNLWSNYNQKFE